MKRQTYQKVCQSELVEDSRVKACPPWFDGAHHDTPFYPWAFSLNRPRSRSAPADRCAKKGPVSLSLSKTRAQRSARHGSTELTIIPFFILGLSR